ncbi:MAG: hypothetical protein O7H41_13585 [Planctomycetota bacterium]|nr:hypothetical protein [Planctomycetota bacterium]
MRFSVSPNRLRGLGTAMLIVVLTVTALLWSVSMISRSVAFAFAVNLALMAFAGVIWSIVPIRFGRGYYRVRPFERSGRLYESLEVRLFQRVLRSSGLYGRSPFPRYVRGPTGWAVLDAATLGPETAHLLIFLVVSTLSLDVAFRGWWDTAGWLVMFNVLLNAYPVLSMRYVRVRTERLFGPSDGRRKSHPGELPNKPLQPTGGAGLGANGTVE